MKKLSDKVASLPVSAALQVDLKVKELEAQGKRIINFCVGEPDLPTPRVVCEAGHLAIDNGDTRYTNAPGTPELRKAIAAHLQKQYGLRYDHAEIAVTTGGKYAVYAAIMALTDPGDEVLLPAPYWTSYYHIITLAGAVPVVIRAKKENGWKITPEEILLHVTPKTKAVILNNPNNPSGAVYSKEELLALSDAFQKIDCYVVADEIYDRFLFTQEPFVSLPSLSEDMRRRTVLINGFSKAYAMTGWRIGYAAADKSILKCISAMLSHTTGCPNAIAQKAAICALANAEPQVLAMREIFRERRDILAKELSGIEGLSFELPEGAFYAMLCLEGKLLNRFRDGATFSMALLEECGVGTVPCADYGIAEAVRISYSIETEAVREGARRIREFCKGV